MDKEIENLIRKSVGKDIEIEMLEAESRGLIINKEEILIILKKLIEQNNVTN